MKKGRQSADTSQSCEKKKTHFAIYVTKNYVSLFLYSKKAYKNERENKVTK